MTDVDTITSSDGTTIAYHRTGTGPALVPLHGSGGANPIAWTDVLPRFVSHCTVYAPDRRGYRASGDGPHYALEREVEDVAALLGAIGQPAFLLGHSYGALCALEGALRTPTVAKLILYEPAFELPRLPVYPPGFIDRLEAMLEAHDREGVLITLYREIAGMSPEEIEELRASPAWEGRLASAHNVLREARVEERYRFDPDRLAALHVPTLLLRGSDSPSQLNASTEALAQALPNRRLAALAGQQHIAMYTAPELFAHEVLSFLLEPS